MTDEPLPDGRTRRADEGRRRVSEALVALVVETGVMPDVAAVARRARVGRRSVFRYFDGVEGLEVETAREMRRTFTERVPLPEPAGSFEARLAALALHRGDLYEAITPVRRFLDAARVRGNPPIDAIVDEGRAALRAHLCRMLAPELERHPGALAGADLATSWEGWRALREGQGLSVARARAEIIRVLQALFAAPQTRRRQPGRGRTGPARSRS